MKDRIPNLWDKVFPSISSWLSNAGGALGKWISTIPNIFKTEINNTLKDLSPELKGQIKKALGWTGFATGGHIVGPGTGTSDSIPAMLSNGEYVVKANAVKALGVDTLDKINQADRMKFATGGLVGKADGGYIDRNNPEYWDARRRYIMHKNEYLWLLAERFLPYQPPGTTLNDFAQQIIASNKNPNSGNPSKLSIGEHVFIPGISYPPKSGEPLKPFKKKKPLFVPGGSEIKLSESHVGQGGGGIGGGLFGFGPRFYANGGMVGYAGGGRVKRDGIPNPFIDPMGWLQGLVNGIYAGGGNPSGYLDSTAAKGIKTGAKSTLGFYKDYIFDPSDPVDYAMAFVPGGKIIKRGAKVAKDIAKGTSIATGTAKELVKAKLFASSVNVPTVEEILKNRKPNDFTIFKQFKEILGSMNVAPEIEVALDAMTTSSKYMGASVNNRGVRKGVEVPLQKFSGHFMGPDGSQVGKFSTKMFKNPATGKSILQDVHIELDSKYHGKGIGKNFTLQAMELFKKAGVNEINIDAGLSHGGAAWAKAGFKFSKRPWDVLARAQFIAKYIKDENLQKVIKQLESKFSRNKYISPMDILNLKKIVSPAMVKKIGKKSEEAYLDDIGGYGMMLDDFIPTSVIDELPKNVKPTIGNLIMYGSNWEGFKTLNKAKGGLAIPRFKTGGYVGAMPRFGDGGLANLHPGEYVFQKSAVDRIGAANLSAANQTGTWGGDSVYNTYSVNVNVSSNSNPNDIANTVVREIRRLDDRAMRSNRR